jgi:hypothetical protein
MSRDAGLDYVEVRNPKWANEAHTMINCEVNFTHIPEDFVPFSAVAEGDYVHSHNIFAECVTGMYGPIAEWEPEPPLTTEQLDALARMTREELLKASDWTQNIDVPQATKDKWASYRQALRDITAQAGYPQVITWPDTPV